MRHDPYSQETYYSQVVEPRIFARQVAKETVAQLRAVNYPTDLIIPYTAQDIVFECYKKYNKYAVIPYYECRWIAERALVNE